MEVTSRRAAACLQARDRATGERAPLPKRPPMHRIELAAPRYVIIAWGDLPADDVVPDYDPRRRPKPSKEQSEIMAAEAQAMRDRGLRVEPLPLYRYLGCTCSPRKLLLKLGHTDYEQYLGLNRLHRDWAEAGGADLRADALGLATVLECPDGVVVEKRSQQVAEAAGLLHVKPSGHAHPPQGLKEAVLEEAEAELGLAAEEVQDLRCLGHVRVAGTDKVIVIYRARTDVPLAEMRARARSEEWESERLDALPLDPEALARQLAESGDELTAAGHAALLMDGWRRFGNEWFSAVTAGLRP